MKLPWMPVSIFRQCGESDCQMFVFWVRESYKKHIAMQVLNTFSLLFLLIILFICLFGFLNNF